MHKLDLKFRRTVLMCCALAMLVACSKSDTASNESVLGYKLSPGETHLTFTLREVKPNRSFAGRPALTFRIPREYVRFQGVLSKNGQIYQVPLQIELPGPTPWQERPWLKGKQGTPEWEEFSKGWIGKFIVVLGSGSGTGGRAYFLNSINPKDPHRRKSIVADGEAYGLVRYSPIRCYTPKDLENPRLKEFLDAKPADDPMPEANCRVDRRGSSLFTSEIVTASDEVVYISCADASCEASFDFEEVGASMGLRQDELPRWHDLVNPTRELLRSFIVQVGADPAQQPPPTSSSFR